MTGAQTLAWAIVTASLLFTVVALVPSIIGNPFAVGPGGDPAVTRPARTPPHKPFEPNREEVLRSRRQQRRR